MAEITFLKSADFKLIVTRVCEYTVNIASKLKNNINVNRIFIYTDNLNLSPIAIGDA